MNIYVGNLSYATTEEDLRAEFASYGQVTSVAVIKDKMTGQSRGFGFVEMPVKSEAIAAIAALNNKELNGRSLRVNEARPREEGQRDFSGGRRGGERSSGRRSSW